MKKKTDIMDNILEGCCSGPGSHVDPDPLNCLTYRDESGEKTGA